MSNLETRLLAGPLAKGDLPEASRIFRLAFGTFLGLPDPTQFDATSEYVVTRWLADPAAAFAVKAAGELIGSNFATNWGSVGFFGPLTVRPDFWDKGIAGRLLEPTMALFEKWGTKHAGLFTFAQSPKHVGLYQKFGFWPRYLTAILSRPVGSTKNPVQLNVSAYSELRENERDQFRKDCRALCDAIYEGLNVDREISAVQQQGLGDTVAVWNGSRLAAFAVCHCGEGTEATRGNCYIKFGAAQPGPAAPQYFDGLLAACEDLARTRGLTRVVAGMNLGRDAAYRRLIAAGFRSGFQGVAMAKPNEPGYNRADVYLIDDWR